MLTLHLLSLRYQGFEVWSQKWKVCGAMVLGKLSVPGRPTSLEKIWFGLFWGLTAL